MQDIHQVAKIENGLRVRRQSVAESDDRQPDHASRHAT
jgi:hypothetical protein